jgi:hypothetical protein
MRPSSPSSKERMIAPARQENANTRLHGLSLWLCRASWIALALGILGFFFAGLPVYISNFQRVCPGHNCAAGQLAPESVRVPPILSSGAGSYPTYMVVFQLVSALVWFVVGVVIFWKKSNDWMALLVALMLMLLGTADATHILAETPTIWQMPAIILNALTFGLVFVVFALFPNGRLAPRWAGALIVLYLASVLLDYFFPGSPLAVKAWPIPVAGAAWFGLVAALALAQVHRYWGFSSLVQRQQTKWVVLGVAAAVVAGGFWVPDLLFVSLRRPGSLYQAILLVVNFMPLLVPLSIGFSILRYRLWAIDSLINRAIVYSMLTGILTLIYVGSVFALEYLLRGVLTETSGVAILASTVVVAALFQPLRRRVQAAIDRRFYRQKYAAGRLMATFSASLRDEVDLQQLSEHLQTIVEQTLQPTYVDLWFCIAEEAQSEANA